MGNHAEGAALKLAFQLPGYKQKLPPAQVILGSQPHDDGTFDRTNTFATLVSNGAWSVPSADAARRADQVAYIVPAAKGATPPRIIAWPCVS